MTMNPNGVTYTYTGTTLTRTYSQGGGGSLTSVTLPSSNVFSTNTSQALIGALGTTNYAVMPGVTDTITIAASVMATFNIYIGGTTTLNSAITALATVNLFVDGGSLTLSNLVTALSNTTITLDNGGSFGNGAAGISILSGVTINFDVNGGTLVATGNGTSEINLSNTTINNFNVLQDTIEFKNLPATVTSYKITGASGGPYTVTLLNGTTTIGKFIAASTSLTTGIFVEGQSGPLTFTYDAGADVFVSAATSTFYCFMAGTHILTPAGEVMIEDLRAGDLVITASGKAMPIKSLDVTYVSSQMANDKHAQPVKILAGAFAEGLPKRDLYVSPDHSFFFEDVLVPAHLLVNGSTICQIHRTSDITYYHLELEPHDLIIAEGVLTESFLNTGVQRRFSRQDVAMLLPAPDPKTWEDACAPLLLSGPRLDLIRAGLRQRATALEGIAARIDIAA